MKQIPEETIKEIADNLGTGMRCFLHTETLELVTYPNEDNYAGFEEEMWEQEIQTVEKEEDKYVEIVGMESHDSYRVMEQFIATVDDIVLSDKLYLALQQRRPFAHFKDEIDRSGSCRDQWFEFRDQKTREWVEEQLYQHSKL